MDLWHDEPHSTFVFL